MNDIYSAPDADLTEHQEGSEFGSLEKGIAGDYEISVGDVLREAWELTKGAKGKLWIALVIVMVVNGIVSIVSNVVVTPVSTFSPILAVVISQVLITVITLPISAGVSILGIRRAANAELKPESVFNHFGKTGQLFIATLLIYIMIAIGLMLLVLPGIYLMVAYTLTLPLIVEKNLSPWQAMEASRKAIGKNWFVIFGIYFVSTIIFILSAIPLLIGLIWTLPWFIVIMGVMYRTIFGVEKNTLAEE